MKVLALAGTRPEVIRPAAVMRRLEAPAGVNSILNTSERVVDFMLLASFQRSFWSGLR